MLLVVLIFFVIFFSVYNIIKSTSNLSSNSNVVLVVNLLFYTVILAVVVVLSIIFLFFVHFNKRLNKISKIAVREPEERVEIQEKEEKGVITAIKGFFEHEITTSSNFFLCPKDKQKMVTTPKKALKSVKSVSKIKKNSEFSDNGSKFKNKKNEGE